MLRVALFMLMLSPTILSANNSHERLISLTRDYVATLDRDPIAHKGFYTPNARFTDPTSALFGQPWDFEGPDNIVSFFVNASEDSRTLAVKYNIVNMIVQPPYVSAHIESTVTACAVGLELPTKVFTGVIKLAMVLKFEGDKIQQRTDYAEYSNAFDFLEKMKPAIAKQADDPRCERK